MIFPLVRVAKPTPLPSYHNNRYRDRPLVNLEVLGPGGSVWTRVLLDSGSDDVVFPIGLATRLGVNLSGIPTGTASGVGGSPIAIQFAPVIMRLTDGIEVCRWRALVGFSSALTSHALFGI